MVSGARPSDWLRVGVWIAAHTGAGPLGIVVGVGIDPTVGGITIGIWQDNFKSGHNRGIHLLPNSWTNLTYGL